MSDNLNQLKNENRLLKSLISEIAVENKILNLLSDVESETPPQAPQKAANPGNLKTQNAIDSNKVNEVGQRDSFSLKDAKVAMESNMITKALKFTHGNRTHAARLLEISHPSLLSKIKEYGIKV